MKTINKIFVRVGLLSVLAIAATGQAYAVGAPSLEQAKLACFQQHHQVMDKPSNRNVDACWRAHGYKVSE